MKIIYLKYGELTLKGKNKKIFINQLFSNIKVALKNFSVKIIKKYDSCTIEVDKSEGFENVLHVLTTIPGIALVIPAYQLERDFDILIKEISSKLIDQTHLSTFKVETKRHDKKYELNSMEFSRKLGHFLLQNNKQLKVDVKNPQIKITVEIHTEYFIYYFERIKGLGGFPIGCGGKVLMLISGGIDSPVAAHLLMKKGYKVDFVTFVSPPHTKPEALDKVRTLVKKLTFSCPYTPKLYVVNFTKLQHEISHIFDHSYQITIMRRYFFRIAEHLKNTYEYDAIATGESLGQVASQTIQSMNTIESVLENTVVLRPLLTFDKLEIINIANKVGTYETSILPFEDSCSLFVPANPVTKPTIHKALKLENELELISGIYNITIEKHIKQERIK